MYENLACEFMVSVRVIEPSDSGSTDNGVNGKDSSSAQGGQMEVLSLAGASVFFHPFIYIFWILM